jgi:hypothetical protein
MSAYLQRGMNAPTRNLGVSLLFSLSNKALYIKRLSPRKKKNEKKFHFFAQDQKILLSLYMEDRIDSLS